MVELKQPHLTPLYDPYSHLVYAAGAGDVRQVDGAGPVADARPAPSDLGLGVIKERARQWAQKIQPNLWDLDYLQ